MTQPAEVASNWDWARLTSRVRGVREASVHLYRRIASIQEAREVVAEERRARDLEARQLAARGLEERDAPQQADADAALADHDPHLEQTERPIDDEPEVEP